MAYTFLTRKQVLDWNTRWSLRDLEVIEAALDALPEGCEYYMPESKSYISSWVRGEAPRGMKRMDYRAFVIHPGSIEWPSLDLVPKSVFLAHYDRITEDTRWMWDDWQEYVWLPFSTWRAKGDVLNHTPAESAVCPTCFIALPATGTCDTCG